MLSLEYIAGFFDGEGCVNFSRTRTSFFPRVLIVNTNLEILESIQDRFGGDIKPLSLRREGWKQGYMLRISWKRAVEFLKEIYPFLVIKRAQAENVFKWQEIAPGGGKRWTPETLALRSLIIEDNRRLNKKGPVADA